MTTPLHELISVKLGEPLGDWVGRRQSAGSNWSDMAILLLTEHNIRVSSETLRRWYCQPNDKVAA